MTAFAFTASTYAINIQELFDSVNAQGNVNNPAMLQGRTMNLCAGGSLFMWMPRRTYQLATVTPPNRNAGYGGIDLFTGGSSFINKEQFVAMLRNTGSNALGYGFKLTIQNLCPTCDNMIRALQAMAQVANRFNMGSCEAARGIVNTTVPDTWTHGKQDVAKNFSVDTSIFENITDTWTNVMNSEGRTNQTMNLAANARPEAKDQLPTSNVVWKALKKFDGVADEQRIILTSMIGSMIFLTGDTPRLPIPLPRKEITVEALVGARTISNTITVPIWRCGTTSTDGCLSPTEDEVTTKSLKTTVRKKMEKISDKITNRSAHDDMAATIGLLNVTDLPIYKMLAVTTTLNNTSMANVLVDRYQELVATKYAGIYVQRVITDLHGAMAKFSATANATQAAELGKMRPKLGEISHTTKQVLATAYSQTINTYNIAQEVQYMERALNANLSRTLRDSLTFSKGLR